MKVYRLNHDFPTKILRVHKVACNSLQLSGEG